MTPSEPKPVLTRSQRELLAFLFESQRNAITAPLASWVAASPRYASFVEKYKDKIRKKLRGTREKEGIADLLYELQIPYWLLHDTRFEVAYEPYAAGKTRGPDYSVTFRTNFTFNIEITHVRGLYRTPPASPGNETTIDFRLVDVLCSKLRQLLANMANLLFVVAAPSVVDQLDLRAHIAWIRDKAERSDPLFYARHRFSGASDFFRYFGRLSGLTLHDSAGVRKYILWLNPQSTVELPDPVKHILRRGFAS